MQFSSVLAVLTALIASVSASNAATGDCPFFALIVMSAAAAKRQNVMVLGSLCMRQELNNMFTSNKFYCRSSNGDFGREEICHSGVCHYHPCKQYINSITTCSTHVSSFLPSKSLPSEISVPSWLSNVVFSPSLLISRVVLTK